MKPAITLAALLVSAGSVAGCAQSACSDPDVLAFVENVRQSHDLYAIGLTDGAVRETPIAGSQPGQVNPHAAFCSAWLLLRNPGYEPGNRQAQFVRTQQNFWVTKLAAGYEVGVLRSP